jgi:anaerobic selenocysteine-containing dehydrogenase
VYGLNDRYRGISGMRDIVFVNPEDLAALGIKPGERIDVTSHWDDGERHLRGFRAIPYEMPRGTAAAYFPEANVLVPVGHVAEGSNTPASKSIEVSLVPVNPSTSVPVPEPAKEFAGRSSFARAKDESVVPSS